MATVHTLVSEQLEGEIGGKRGRVVRYFVGVEEPEVAKADPRTPREGTNHPTDTPLRADRVTAQANGRGGCIVEALYSNDRRYGGNNGPNRDRDALPSDWLLGGYEAIVEIPCNVRETFKTPVQGGGTPQTYTANTVVKIKVAEPRITATLTVRLKLNTFQDVRTNIIEQNRTIHTIRGQDYLFTTDLRAMRQVDDETYEVKYTWELDEGTSIPTPQAGPNFVFVSESALQDPRNPGSVYMREPYCQIIVLPPADPETTPFSAKSVCPYRRDASGWRNLPGVPNL